MTKPPSKTPMAGGFLLALSLIVGVFAGIARGEASFGFLIGLGVGIALLILVWLADRMRTGR
ncbi:MULTISPECIES: hypothetical protein [Sphingomonas]|jgi:hypothetical protein|uniref:Uncharacterized protein n=1 Tax=Sphingomonas leidyi TaxID=68569 RepID=A0A7X5V2I4_9SPHN|nr:MULTISPECIES: hypothetical protein [Sphingomonas]MBN8812453.1 hypothetical protein [Sphingomonas sp.]MDF2386408.1 hypothetical protein [Nostoc ellipsosporum NOK]NIJ66724.1 hypothetical protein [Sphingomonas leidyi]OJY52217.1 MAG: hypothetical protein BGP17_15510 [Sphingomonas sp. 67-41]